MADLTPQEANAQGLGWVDKNNPNYGKPGFVGSTPTSGGGSTNTPTTGGGLTAAAPPPSPTQPLQPSPAPSVGLGNTVDAPSGGAQRTQAPGLLDANAQTPQASPAAQTPQQQMQAQLRTSIMGLLGTNPNAISTSDADIAPQSQAFAAAAQRQQAARRAEVVQAAQRSGYANSGGLEQRLDSLSQQTGQAIGQHDADLIGQKQQQRVQQLQFALSQAQSLGMADEANNLQRQLANLQASVATRGQDVQREQTGVTQQLGLLDDSTRRYLGDLNARMQQQGYTTQERLAAMDAEVKKYGIDTQGRLGDLDAALRNRQIDLGYDTLGVDVAKTQAGLNRDAVVNGLG